VLSNHDVVRHPSRLGLPLGQGLPKGIGIDDPQPDEALGLHRARAASLLMLALPGSAYLYQGEELGLPEHTTLPDDVRQDPTWRRSNGTERGRDGCRVPIPWEADAPSYGFGPTDNSWLPQPPSWATYALDRQVGIPASTYEVYREALRLRREFTLGTGELSWLDAPTGVLAFRVAPTNVVVVTNFGPDPVALSTVLPDGYEVLHCSAALDGDLLHSDVTIWVRSA
jgi:alpha-glucosidase